MKAPKKEMSLEQILQKSINAFDNGEKESFEKAVDALDVTGKHKKELIELHNKASTEETYGESLYAKLATMFPKDMVDKLYVLSLEYPMMISA